MSAAKVIVREAVIDMSDEENTLITAQTKEKISGVCSFTPVTDDHAPLLENLRKVLPGLDFGISLVRGGWHRPGGVLGAGGERIGEHLEEWLAKESGGDIARLTAVYSEAGLVVTWLHGKTLYLVARVGPATADFVQLEIEILQEAQDHLLFQPGTLPDGIQDLLEPVDVEPVEAVAVGKPRYAFRRITPVADYLDRMARLGSKGAGVQRFFRDWARSSAGDGEHGHFSDHWVLGLREYTDAYGEPVMIASPVNTHDGEIPYLDRENMARGSKLANMIHGFDRDLGYPMAWFFCMLTHGHVPYEIAQAIHHDQMGAYDYLPAKDLKVLIDWYNKPYSV